jgi:hypothetical protein
MKNVTLSADEHLIEQARQLARAQNKTLNQAFREWLSEFTTRQGTVHEYEALMRDIAHSGLVAGGKFTRDEMNER